MRLSAAMSASPSAKLAQSFLTSSLRASRSSRSGRDCCAAGSVTTTTRKPAAPLEAERWKSAKILSTSLPARMSPAPA
jgi:hypothetical protein